jgi:hypothetical protein
MLFLARKHSHKIGGICWLPKLANWQARPVWHNSKIGPNFKDAGVASFVIPLHRDRGGYNFHILFAQIDIRCKRYEI